MRVFVETYGCTLNQADSEIMKGVLAEREVEFCSSEDADVVVLNTCFVKKQTEQRIIERLKRLAGKRVVVAGCMTSANRRIVEDVSPNASLVGTSSISRVYDAVESAYEDRKSVFLDAASEDKYMLPGLERAL